MGERIFGIFFLLVSAIYFAIAFTIKTPPGLMQTAGPEVFPKLIGSAFVAVSMIFLARSLRRKSKSAAENITQDSGVVRKKGLFVREFAPLFLISICILLYTLLLEIIGFLVTTVALTVAVSVILGGRRWVLIFLVSVLFSLAIYFFFTKFLGLPLPQGLLRI